RPAQHPVVWNVAPEHAVVLRQPHGTFAPARAGAQALERRRAGRDRPQARVGNLYRSGVHVVSHSRILRPAAAAYNSRMVAVLHAAPKAAAPQAVAAWLASLVPDY